MKRTLSLLALGALLLLAAPYMLASSARAFKGQIEAPKPWWTPLPPQLTTEEAQQKIIDGKYLFLSPQDRSRIVQLGSFDWSVMARQGQDVMKRLSGPNVTPSPLQIHIFAKPPFDPVQVRGFPLSSPNSTSSPKWQGDTKFWLRIDGIDPRVLPSANPSALKDLGLRVGDNSWGFSTRTEILGMRRTHRDPWRQWADENWQMQLNTVFARAELFEWQSKPWLCVHVRSWGGGQWRYLLSPIINFPTYFQPSPNNPFPSRSFVPGMALLPLRVETSAPVYGNIKLPPPWPRTQFDFVSSHKPLLRSIEFLDEKTQRWKGVPKRGEKGFPLSLSSAQKVQFRAVARDASLPWPSSPQVYPHWTATRDKVVVADQRGAQSSFISSLIISTNSSSSAKTTPGFIKTPDDDWQIRPSSNSSDLMTITVSAGNTLQTQVRVLPLPTPAPTPVSSPTVIEIPTQSSSDNRLGAHWGGIEYLSPMRPGEPQQGAMWAIQKMSIPLAAPKFRASLWLNDPSGWGEPNDALKKGDLKVVFHSRFDDGTPCGTWSEAEMPKFELGRANDAIAIFNPPKRLGKGHVWVEVFNRNGEQLARSKDENFAVCSLALSCGVSQWKATQNPDEWSRDIQVFAGAQVPDSQTSAFVTSKPSAKPVRLTSRSIEPTYTISPMEGIPIRLSLRPSSFIDKETRPESSLSLSKGITGPFDKSPGTYIQTVPRIDSMMGYTPCVIANQTVRWKLGDSNQIDCTRVVAELDLPKTPVRSSAIAVHPTQAPSKPQGKIP